MSIKSDVRRNEDGSIDIAFYKRRAQRIMREACKARAELMHSIFLSALARLRGLPKSVLRKTASMPVGFESSLGRAGKNMRVPAPWPTEGSRRGADEAAASEQTVRSATGIKSTTGRTLSYGRSDDREGNNPWINP